jgi:hypothetical protein
MPLLLGAYSRGALVACALHKELLVNHWNQMKTNTATQEVFESTYALIVRSEEKERGVSEGAVYLVVMLSVIFSIWQVAQQPVTLPTNGIIHSPTIAQSATLQVRT